MAVFTMRLGPPGDDVLRVERRTLTGVRVFANDALVGAVPSTVALREGARFTLPDGRALYVVEEATRGFGHRLRVELDGRLLEGCSAHPYHDIRRAAHVTLAIGVVTLLLFGNAYVRVEALRSATIRGVIEGAVYVVLALGVYGRRQVAMLFAIVLSVIDVFVICGALSIPWLAMVRCVLLLPMINGWTAFDALAKVPRRDATETFR